MLHAAIFTGFMVVASMPLGAPKFTVNSDHGPVDVERTAWIW